MTQDQAVAVVERHRGELEIEPDMAFEKAEKAIVRYKRNPSRPGRVQDRVAWLVTYSNDMAFVEIHVDDAKGKVLRTRRSA